MPFDKVWDAIHAERRWGVYPNERLVAWAAPLPRGRILDLGCGQGASAWYLAREGWDVVGLDGSPAALKKAREYVYGQCQSARWIAADAASLPFKDACFDAAVDIVSSAHNAWQDCLRIFAELARVLRRGARLFSLLPRWDCSREPFEGKGPITFFYDDMVERLLPQSLWRMEPLGSDTVIRRGIAVRHWMVEATRT